MKCPNHRLALLSLCIASGLLTACGGGGGGGVLVRQSPPPSAPPNPPTPTPSPPTAPSAEPCPAPINGPCLVEAQYTLTFDEYGMSGGRQSDYGLTISGGDVGGGWVNLKQGEYRFAGGTRIAGATLVVWDRLVSDVDILHDDTGLGFAGESELWLLGTVRGDVINAEHLNLRCWSGIHACASVPQQRIEGNYTQMADGSLEITIGRNLQVTGTATVDGHLLLVKGDAGYVLPTAQAGILVLHADGGVGGTFDGWRTDSLFLEGGLRYTDHDVFFDATRISLQTALAANHVGNALTLASAANLDRAFGRADGLARDPGSLSTAERQLLGSAGALLQIANVEQARRSLDSLSGAAHADALQATLQQGIADPATSQRLTTMHPGLAAGAWSLSRADGSSAGVDQWLGPRLLAGMQAGQRVSATQGAGGDHASVLAPQASAYLRWYGDNGWYAGGSLGYTQETIAVDRRIDLAAGGRWNARARYRFNLAGLQAEAGRSVAFAGGVLSPYAGMAATALRSDRVTEQGTTGFEMAFQPTLQAQLDGRLGLRFGREWRFDDTGWLRLDADARVQRRLAHGGDPLRAAFVGVPDLWFEVPSTDAGHSAWFNLGLQGGFGRQWSWSLDATQAAGQASASAATWRIGLRRAF